MLLQNIRFCRKHACSDQSALPLRDRLSANQWLRDGKRDRSAMLALRQLLSDAGGATNLSRLSDNQVIDRVAGLLASGSLHLHVSPAVPYEKGGAARRPAEAAPGSAKSAPTPAPKPARPAPAPVPSGTPAMDFDPVTFPPRTDVAAQVATLIAASNAGAAICYI